jgi:hypothetical protein
LPEQPEVNDERPREQQRGCGVPIPAADSDISDLRCEDHAKFWTFDGLRGLDNDTYRPVIAFADPTLIKRVPIIETHLELLFASTTFR